jgi:predicted phosphodiesterase
MLSDIHGDVRALDAVLADIARCAVDEYWVIGDLVAHGPRPAEVLDRLRGLPAVRAVRGNTDRYVLTGELSAMIPPDDWTTRLEASRALGWTFGAVAQAGHRDWLAGLPSQLALELPSGERVLLVHAAPGTDDGPGLYDEMTDQELLASGVSTAGAELVVSGHTHAVMDRTVGGIRVVNTGSVGNPLPHACRSTWALLVAGAHGYTVEQRSCPFDTHGFLADLDRSSYPSARWLKSRQGHSS